MPAHRYQHNDAAASRPQFTALPGKRIKLSNSASPPAKVDHKPLQWPLATDQKSRDIKSQPQPSNGYTGRYLGPLGITLDTNVTRHNASPPEQLFPRPRVEQPLQVGAGKAAGPDCTALETTLSPCDRHIPIALSHDIAADAIAVDGRAQHKPSPLLPEHIRPTTMDKTPVVVASPVMRHNTALRAPSSVYTRAYSHISRQLSPHNPNRASPFPPFQRNTPPVPRLASPFNSNKLVSRPCSDHTIFSEDVDASSLSETCSALKTASNWHARASMETVPPTPRRSRGWWNVITSPFMSRHGSTAFAGQRTKASTADAPELPILRHAGPIASTSRDIHSSPDEPDCHVSGDGIATQRTTPVMGEAAEYYNRSLSFPDHPTQPPSAAAELHLTPKEKYVQPEPTMAREGLPLGNNTIRRDTTLSQESRTDFEGSSRTTSIHSDPSKSPPGAFHLVASSSADRRKHGNHQSFESEEFGHAIIKSPDSPWTASSPIVETAAIGHVQTARGVQTKAVQQPSVADESYLQARDKATAREPAPPLPPPPAVAYWPKQTHVRERPSELQEKAGGSVVRPTHHAFRDSQPLTDKRWTRERIILAGVGAALFLVTLLSLVLAMTVTQRHSDMPVQAQWLNLSGFPPLPTGIVTVAQPSIKSQSACVIVPDLWSCALPKEQQATAASNASDQPDFRIEIRFDGNKQELSNSSSSALKLRLKRRAFEGRGPTALARHAVLRARDAFTSIVQAAYPSPPSQADQIFLGNTTDGISPPYEGEATPFLISFLPVSQPVSQGSQNSNSTPSRLVRRSSNPSNGSSVYDKFPQPSTVSGMDPVSAPAELYPLPVAQPLKLYNRNSSDEHYGFYTYFDRSLFFVLPNISDLSSVSVSNPMNANGGPPMGQANARCTWSQTRFLVKIWTRPSGEQQLSPSTTSSTGPGNGTQSATDFTAPGTFPLPVTISLDRHGGDASQKAVYCYGLNDDSEPVTDEKAIISEARGLGGTLVNPAPGAFESAQVGVDKQPGGSDGGSGGCGCSWANYQ